MSRDAAIIVAGRATNRSVRNSTGFAHGSYMRQYSVQHFERNLMRCERCGKFRASKDIAINWHGEMYYGGGEVQECIWCMSPADKARHEGKTDEA